MEVEIKKEPENDLEVQDQQPSTEVKEEKERKPQQWFECGMCHMREQYDEKNQRFSEQKYINLRTECYLMRDPFTHPNRRQFLILGSDCADCGLPVCQSLKCSIYHERRFCQKCAFAKKSFFPVPIRNKIIEFDIHN